MRKVFIAAAMLVAGTAGAQQAAPGGDLCASALRASARDPSSVQIVRVTRSSAFKATIGGREMQVQGYEVVANAKNGFGGYTGNTGYICLLDAAERTVVDLRQF